MKEVCHLRPWTLTNRFVTRREQNFIGDHVKLEVEAAMDEVLDASTDAAMLLWRAFDPYQPMMLEQQVLNFIAEFGWQ